MRRRTCLPPITRVLLILHALWKLMSRKPDSKCIRFIPSGISASSGHNLIGFMTECRKSPDATGSVGFRYIDRCANPRLAHKDWPAQIGANNQTIHDSTRIHMRNLAGRHKQRLTRALWFLCIYSWCRVASKHRQRQTNCALPVTLYSNRKHSNCPRVRPNSETVTDRCMTYTWLTPDYSNNFYFLIWHLHFISTLVFRMRMECLCSSKKIYPETD